MEESLAHLLTDVNHWAFEVVAEVLFFAVEYVIIRRAIAAYDRVKHGHKHNGRG